MIIINQFKFRVRRRSLSGVISSTYLSTVFIQLKQTPESDNCYSNRYFRLSRLVVPGQSPRKCPEQFRYLKYNIGISLKLVQISQVCRISIPIQYGVKQMSPFPQTRALVYYANMSIVLAGDFTPIVSKQNSKIEMIKLGWA